MEILDYHHDSVILEMYSNRVGGMMLKTVVLYCSKTEYTRKYAEWIAEDLSLEAYDLNKVQDLNEAVNEADTVIFGGGLYAIGINGLKKLMAQVNFEKISSLYVFCTGLSVDSAEVQIEIYKNNLKDVENKQVKLYYYRGGFDFGKLGFLDRLLMRVLKLKINVKK